MSGGFCLFQKSKNNQRVNILKIASVYTGTVLGAGFASGKELISFFINYGVLGFFGMLVSGFFFSMIGYGVLKIIYDNKISSYTEFSAFILGKKLGAISEWISCAFLLVLFSAMISAGGEMSKSVFGISKLNSEIILSVLCLITFLFELNGFIEINTLLAPILVIGGILTGIYIYVNPETVTSFSLLEIPTSKITPHNFISSAIIYVSYNIITAVTVLVSLNKLTTTKNVAKYGGVLGGICVCLLGISMSLPLFSNFNKIHSDQMPVLTLVLDYQILKYVYVIILLSAIFTTALANGFSLIENFNSKNSSKLHRLFTKIFLTLWGIFMAQISFSDFIEKIYPIFGLFGIFEVVLIIKKAFIKPVGWRKGR